MALDTYVPGMCTNSTAVYIIIIVSDGQVQRLEERRCDDELESELLSPNIVNTYKQTNKKHIAHST